MKPKNVYLCQQILLDDVWKALQKSEETNAETNYIVLKVCHISERSSQFLTHFSLLYSLGSVFSNKIHKKLFL